MAVITKEITIDADVGTVFEFLSKPSNLTQIWPNLISVTNEQQLSSGGYSFDWVYKLGKIILKGKGKHTDIALNQWLVAKTKGAIDCSITWATRNYKGNTRLFLTFDFQITVPILGWLVENILLEVNNEAELILSNLQTKLRYENRKPLTSTYSFINVL